MTSVCADHGERVMSTNGSVSLKKWVLTAPTVPVPKMSILSVSRLAAAGVPPGTEAGAGLPGTEGTADVLWGSRISVTSSWPWSRRGPVLVDQAA
jgi:hypothetical protein